MAFLKHISASAKTDNELLQDYKQSGDLQVLAHLYQRYMDLVYGVCLKYLKDAEEAKDSTLTIFEELIGKARKHEITHFKNWLYGVAKNHCLMQLRSNKKFSKAAVDVSLMQNEEIVHLNGELENEEQAKQLQLCLQQLSTEQRQVIQLFYLEGKCYNEIVTQTGLEWNKVRSAIQNGRRALKLCMQKEALSTA